MFLLSVGKEENKIIGVSTKQVMNAKCSKMYHLNRHIVPQATESFIKSDYSVGPTFITKKILDLPNHIINLKMIILLFFTRLVNSLDFFCCIQCHVYSTVVSRFLSKRLHPKSRRLLPFYFSNIMLQTDQLTFGIAAAVFGIAGGMRRLPAYFDNRGSRRLLYAGSNYHLE